MTSSFDRVRVLWPDHLGLARGKYVPASLADHGARHCTGTWALGYDRGMTPETPGSHWNEGLPDFDAVFDMADVRPGWEPNTKVVVATSCAEAKPFAVSPRARPRVGPSPTGERSATSPTSASSSRRTSSCLTASGAGKPMDTPGRLRLRHRHRRSIPYGLVDAIWAAGERCGDSARVGQLRVRHAAVRVHASLQRRPARRRRGVPLQGARPRGGPPHGPAAHLHGQAPVATAAARDCTSTSRFVTTTATNVINDADGSTTVSRRSRSTSIGGMLAHHRALAGLCAPTVNAYKRLRPASLSGYWANWGYDHRGATVRVPPERGDGSPRAPSERRRARSCTARWRRCCRRRASASSTRPSRATREVATDSTRSTRPSGVPPSLADALDALEADTELVDAIGDELVAQHVAVKRTEWDRFTAATTDWEMREYLPFL